MHKLVRLAKDPKIHNLFQNPMVSRAHFIRGAPLKECPDLSPQQGHSQMHQATRRGEEMQKKYKRGWTLRKRPLHTSRGHRDKEDDTLPLLTWMFMAWH